VFDLIWIIFFLVLAIMEGSSSTAGLAALEILGRFVLFSGLCIIGVIALVIVGIIQLILIRRRKRK
jgi:hypothetical protein